MEKEKANQLDILTQKLETEIAWQWKWERHNRNLYFWSRWISWLANLAVFSLALILARAQLASGPASIILIIIASLSGISVFVQVLTHTMKFQSRQRLHDTMAREYEILLMEANASMVDVSVAFERFANIHRKPCESQLD